jgi:hypothetical protein
MLSPFVDLRLKKTGELFFRRMIERKTVIIKKLVDVASEKKRFERWIRHKDVTSTRLVSTEKSRLNDLVKGRHVLGLQDTTEINYQAHDGRSHGLGTVGNGKDIGFFLHPMIALDANTGGVIGCAEINMWNRTTLADENYPKLPIEEKESYRWIETAMGAQKALSKADCVTFIGDRESDIYEFLDRIPNQNTHVITRVCRDRVIENGHSRMLYAHLDHTVEAGRIEIEIPRDIRKSRKKRKALLSIKHSIIKIVKPKKCTDKSAPKSIDMYVVEAKELNCPSDQKPVHWRIFTTHMVNNFEEAKQIILWYRMRWTIEQVFRTLKSQGLNIEESQIESGNDLMKLAVLALCAAIQIMQLISGRDGTTDLKTKDTFTVNERLFLVALLRKIEGKTQKQQNPYPTENIAWASWIIARLGGCGTATLKVKALLAPLLWGEGLNDFIKCLTVGIYTEICPQSSLYG